MNVFYILMFLSLWTMGIVFLRYSFKRNVWISFTLITGGMASFAFSIHLTIMPFILPYEWLNPFWSTFVFHLSVAAMTIYFYLFPLATSMGGLWMGALNSSKVKWILSVVLALPAFILLALHLIREPWNSFDIRTFRWWSGAYFFLGYLFYHAAYLREKDHLVRRNKKRVAFLFSFGTLWAFVSDFIGFRKLTLEEWHFTLESNGAWQLNAVIILGLVAAIIYYSVKYGFLGVKLRFEREKLDSSMRALTMGVSILNHSIKNEIQKIDYLTEKTQSFIHNGQTEKSLQSIEQIHAVTAHLLSMVNQIKDKADDIIINETPIQLQQLFASVIMPMQPLFDRRAVTIEFSEINSGILNGDSVHIKEVLSNLLQNAVDAMENEGGTIILRSIKTKRNFIIEVKDNGCGIPKEQHSKIFEPFYTTKKNTSNHGLGLSYCAAVMRKHGGLLSIADTEIGEGTTFLLQFPMNRYTSIEPASPKVANVLASTQKPET
ncbi:sensor histidine kinase [Paenibacillus sp. 2TAB23]|uniref:sensor histidine kinase n=1 Tax=Paenibacillus sp. 2TAB23 TaxID=3233004 RepID=UPI003F9D9200